MSKRKIKSDEEMLIILGKKLKLPDFEEEDIIDVSNYTNYNVRNAEKDFESLPNHLAIYGILVAKALRRMKKAETNYKIFNSVRNIEIRDKLDKKDEKYTEAKITNLLRKDSEYKKKKYFWHKAEEDYEVLKSIYWAIQKKSEVLIEISRQRSATKKLRNMRIDN